MPIFYALGYESQVGKDTIADILEQNGYLRLSFAKPLHAAINAFKREINDNTATKYRSAMIAMATEAKVIHSDRVFVDIVEQQIANNLHRNIVVTDMRELQQFHMVKKYGFKYVLVTRAQRDTSNPSIETELKDIPCDIHIINDGTFEELEKKVARQLISPDDISWV